MYNALSYDLHNGGNGAPPTYRLNVDVSSSQFVAVINPTSGRPDAAIEVVTASFQLTEIATGKTVVTDTTTMHVDYDIPGSQQRFACAARAARCRGPRGHGCRRGYPQQAGVVLRRRNLGLLAVFPRKRQIQFALCVVSAARRAFAAKTRIAI